MATPFSGLTHPLAPLLNPAYSGLPSNLYNQSTQQLPPPDAGAWLVFGVIVAVMFAAIVVAAVVVVMKTKP